jgi:hypothetical protein
MGITYYFSPMNQAHDQEIHIAPKYRWIENGHILLWLIKDTCWAMEWKPGGIFMIFPTLAVAFYILWRSRKVRAELFHNLAVCLWIMANSVWMIGEFMEHESRPYAVVFFLTGLLLLGIYYIFYFRKDQQKLKEYALGTDS